MLIELFNNDVSEVGTLARNNLCHCTETFDTLVVLTEKDGLCRLR